MGQMLSSLLHLQSIERRLATVRGRLNVRKNAVAAQQRKIDKLKGDFDGLHERMMSLRKEGDQCELDLRQREEKVTQLRGALNTAKTNKEYAAILTQINTLKADNARYEEQALKSFQEADTLKVEADRIQQEVASEEQRLDEVSQASAEEIRKLDAMLGELQQQRSNAAGEVPRESLALFERINANVDGDAMAPLEVHGDKPPYSYICGGCFMSLNAEHANALRSRDEIRTCDSCGRILYMEDDPAATNSR